MWFLFFQIFNFNTLIFHVVNIRQYFKLCLIVDYFHNLNSKLACKANSVTFHFNIVIIMMVIIVEYLRISSVSPRTFCDHFYSKNFKLCSVYVCVCVCILKNPFSSCATSSLDWIRLLGLVVSVFTWLSHLAGPENVSNMMSSLLMFFSVINWAHLLETMISSNFLIHFL